MATKTKEITKEDILKATKPFVLDSGLIEELHQYGQDIEYTYDEKQRSKIEKVEGFEGWYITCDEQTGSYDSGKSAMVDFDIELYDDKDVFRGKASGGYYVQGDYSFNYDLEFTPPRKPKKGEEIYEKFEEKLSDILMNQPGAKAIYKATKKLVEQYEIKVNKQNGK